MVWVDKDGLLHLRIAYINGKWQSSEVICTENMGYGTYVFCLESNVANINERIVLGLFNSQSGLRTMTVSRLLTLFSR
jgi:hypothetical protein